MAGAKPPPIVRPASDAASVDNVPARKTADESQCGKGTYQCTIRTGMSEGEVQEDVAGNGRPPSGMGP